MCPVGAPLRVAILCEFGTVNGGERSLLAALDALKGEVDPIFLAPAEGQLAIELKRGDRRHLPWSVRDSKGVRGERSRVLSDLRQRLTRECPNLVHANSLAMGRLTGQLARTSELCCTAHLRDIIGLSATAVADLNSNRALYAVSSATREFHIGQGIDAARVRVLHNGVDLDRFSPSSSPTARNSLRRQLHIPDSAVVAVTIGQIGLRKGLDVLAASVPELARKYPELHFLWIGERYSKKDEAVAFETDIHRQLCDAGVTSRVHWMGYREDIPEILEAADLLIHPARQEPLGRVLLEAAAAGLPIVATAVGGTPEIVIDGESCLLVPADDAAALGSAVSSLLADATWRRVLGQAARNRMQAHFGIRDRAQELLAAWREIVDR
ncbi:MAG: glycosyltransferase family 4 protein [Planctomycetaceae bacterium]|nr:glycosyltransferase family 4 protein [Planctomycetaceae bacterium]